MRATARWVAPTALAIASASLLLNAVLFWALLSPERWLGPLLIRATDELVADDVRLRYEVRVPVGTPLSADIPIDERLKIRVRTQLPVRTRVRLPIRSPVGNYTVSVPLHADVPIRTDLPVHIRHTLRLRTSTREELVLPLEIRIRDLPLDALRESLNP